MMRTILLLVMVAGCGGGDGAHDEVDCNAGAWNPNPTHEQRCERGCAAGPACAENDTACYATLPKCTVRPASTGFPECTAPYIATYDGKFGCCEDMDKPQVPQWVECQ